MQRKIFGPAALMTFWLIGAVFLLATSTQASPGIPTPGAPGPGGPARHSTPTPRPILPTTSAPGEFDRGACQPSRLIVFEVEAGTAFKQALSALEAAGGCALHVFPPQAVIGSLPPGEAQPAALPAGVRAAYAGEVDELARQRLGIDLGAATQQAIYVWNHNFVHPEPPPVPDPDAPKPLPLAGDFLSVAAPAAPLAAPAGSHPSGPNDDQISEFMAGKVAVSIILPESSGAFDSSTENWDAGRVSQVIGEIQSGMNWLASYNSGGNLSFYYDIHTLVPTQYEPILRSSGDDKYWVSEALNRLGVSGDPDHFLSQVYEYINRVRADYDTDWGVLIFVADSYNDENGMFSNGYFGYTYGSLIVMTYDNDGWGIDNMDSVIAHEVAHNFGAADEYCSPGYACCWGGGKHGYLGYPNTNCEAGCDNDHNGVCDGNQSTANSGCQGCPGCVQVNCLMRSGGLESGLDTPSRYQIGMRDSDGDGRLDPLDTQPLASLAPWPEELQTQDTVTYRGQAVDQPYDSPNRSDVSINHIEAVQYELDYSGDWLSASAADGAFDETSEDFVFTTPALSQGAHTLFIRAINRAGNVSEYLYDTFTVDSLPPSVGVRVAPVYDDAPFLDFWVIGQGEDTGTGRASFDFQYKDGESGAWTDWKQGVADEFQLFVGQDGHTYFFRARARDQAGNLSAYTDGSVSFTVRTCPVDADPYEADNASTQATWHPIGGVVQNHNFNAAGEVDWVRFWAVQGVPYDLSTKNTGGDSDTVIDVYAADGAWLGGNDDDPDAYPASRYVWTPEKTDLYSARIKHWDEWAFGCTTGYEFTISTPVSDTIRPTVAWQVPTQNQQVYTTHNSAVLLQAEVSDNLQVTEVHFYRWDPGVEDWLAIGSAYEPPFQVWLDTTILAPGWNQINVVAYDLKRNESLESPYIWLDRQVMRYLYLPAVQRR